MANSKSNPFLYPVLSDIESKNLDSYEELNKNSLKNMLNYIFKLKENNIINNNEYNNLQQKACSIYIENQAQKMWNNYFDKKLYNKLNKIFAQLLTE